LGHISLTGHPIPPMSIAVLIADDHELVRAGLRGVLERSGFWITAEASTPLETVIYAAGPSVQVVLLDLSWASCTNAARDEGLKLLRTIRSAHPSLPVLMYSVEAGSEWIERCRRAGASGYLIKGVDDAVLAWAVRAVHAGGEIWPGSRHLRLRRSMSVARTVWR
jgi:DNA-binding NarL/FixJ family response regulator